MERYDKVDLDLECEYGGTVAHKASLFGGMFKKPSKAAEPSAKAQDSLSVNGELSTSSDSLAEINSSSSSKDKGGMFKGMFKKTTKSTKDDEPQEASISSQHPELSVSSDSLTDNKSSKDKSGMFGGILKRSPRLGHTRRPSQDLLDFTADENLSESTNTKEASISSQHPELSVSSDSLADNKSSKDKSGMFGGILKRSPRLGHTRRPSQDLLDFTADENLSESTNTKESAGKMKKSPKANGTRAASKEDLTAQSELSKSNDSLSKTKESGGFSAIFKNPFGARAPSQEDVCAAAELPGSSENLSENNTKEKGFFSGMFKKKGARSQSQDDLSVDEELSASNDNLTEKSSKGGVAAKVLKNASSPQEKEKTENCGDQNELSSAAPKPKTKKGGFSAMMKSTFYSDKQEKNSEPDDEESSEGEGDGQPNHKQSKLAGAMTKLNPFKAAQKHEKPPGSDDEDQTVSSEKPSTHKQKDTEDTETPEENRKQSEKKPDLVKRNLIQPERKEKGETPPILRRPRAEEMKATSMHEKERQRRPEEKEKLPVEKKGKRSETPIVPPRPSEEEMNRTVRKKDNQQRSQSGDEGNKNESNVTDDDEKHNSQNKPVKVKKHKHQLYMPQVGFKAASDDEGLKDDESLPKEEKKEEDKDQPEKPKVKKPKKPNPFMQRLRAASDDEGLKDEEEENKDAEDKENPEKPKVMKPKRHNPFMQRFRGASDDEGLKDEEEEDKDVEDKEKPEKPKVMKPKKHNHFMHWAKAASDDEGLNDEEEEIKDVEDKEKPEKPKVKKPKQHNPFLSRLRAASDDEGLKDEDESSSKEEIKDENKDKQEKPKVKKPKQRNPFMPRNRATSDDEGLKDEEDSSSKEEIKEDEEKEIIEKPKVKKPKKHNPFMPRVKPKVIQRSKDGAAGENEEPQRSLFDQLEDFRIEPSRPEDSQEVEDLMDWWNTVESWEDTPQDDDMTEKEEAKAFAVTAEKVQKGIRVFNKLFSERAESLWQHVIDLNAIADGLDKFTKKTKIAQITGGSTSAIGGVATITGLALAPVTMGTSLIVTAVGLGVATAGGLTSAGAGISNQVNNSMDRKKVEKIVEDYQDKIADLNKCLKFIKQGIENLRRFDLLKMKKSAYNQDFPALTSQFYEDGAMAGKAILINANEIMRVVQIANVAGSTAARAVQIASMATGVLTGLFVAMDIYFVAKDSKELKKGAKSDFAAKIREVATQLHDGLVELNTIREELQSTAPDDNREGDVKETEREKNEKYDESSEDEIDRIKKALKKDLENKEYV
ncbi:ankyrin repeat domain-containing protein 11 isoform X3 [Fundulus heteroclitus]|uniref:ankyrin repeat domain-containing protein 11 isoform X3 n=1 Tax=Fundulus heteroclitus TaxID=8078 RepID=UPI00165B0099|nr:ankyrin repeat domain-containing protein 11 isoform X3 [Fundulus heteroclitus]